ncbi:MAG: ABC transporter permease [Sandaracinaceae bacterium]|nr:ABC transporter permease [Sandaracinaceae bacterium]
MTAPTETSAPTSSPRAARKHARSGALRRIVAIARKEALHVQRDPRSLYLALGMPIVLLLLFGYGVSFDMDHLPVVLVDEDRTPESREIADRVFASGDLHMVGRASSGDEAHGIFARREAHAVLILPRGTSESIGRGEAVEAQLLIDGVEANSAAQLQGKAESALRSASLAMSVEAMGPRAVAIPTEVRLSTWFNPEERSQLYLVPGLAAYILAIVAVLLTALTVSREWERSSIQQLFVTPVRTYEIMLGKLVPYFLLGVVAEMTVFVVGAWVFDVPMRGDPLALASASLLFLLGMLGQGMLISIVARNQMVATQVATMTSMLPSMLLSGFVFPIENMPLPLQVISNVVPARYFIHALRGVLLRGNGFPEIGFDLLMLTAFACLMLFAGTKRFKRELA